MSTKLLLCGLVMMVCGFLVVANLAAMEWQPYSATLENEHYKAVFDGSEGIALVELIHKKTGENLIKEPGNLKLFTLQIGKTILTPADFEVASYTEEDVARKMRHTLTLVPKAGGPAESFPLELTFSITTDESWDIAMSLAIKNLGDDVMTMSIALPDMDGIAFGDSAADDYYFYPNRSGFYSDKSVEIERPYSGCWWQMMDLADEARDAGMYIRINDTKGDYKRIYFKKADDENTVTMRFTFVEKNIHPGTSLVLPDAVIGIHPGTWRTALDSYKAWVDTWYRRRKTPEWFKNVFVLRQESMHHSDIWPSGYTDLSKVCYDDEEERYTFDKKLEELAPYAKVEYFHLWRWWQDSIEEGYHGDYWFPDYRGGNARFRRDIEPLQEQGIKFGCYFEGYLLGKHTVAGLAHGAEWGMMHKDGTYWADYGAESFWNACIAYKPWQEYLATSIGTLVSETGINGVYIDSITSAGAKQCYNPLHNHRDPGVWVEGMGEMFVRIREELDTIDPEIALYSEEAGCDYVTQFIDGGFCHSLWVDYTGNPVYNKPGINYFHFYFPDFKMFEIPTYEIVPEKIKLALFNGEALWFQTNTEGSESEEVKAMMKRVTTALEANKDVFTCDHPEPLVATLVDGIYANRFPTEHKVVYTFHNTTDKELSGVPIIEVEHRQGYTYIDTVDNGEVKADINGSLATLTFDLAPGEVTAITQIPE